MEEKFSPEPHYIAYLDMLGYESEIKRRGIPEIARLMKKHIDSAKSIVSKYINEDDEGDIIKMKVFSDNMFFCTRKNWKVLIALAAVLQNSMIQDGIFTRGALCYEQLYFNDDFLCGDGIILAHKIESEIAVFPRVILHSTYIDAINNEKIPPSVNDEFEFMGILSDCIVDNDDCLALNYLPIACQLNGDADKNKDMILKHKEVIVQNLQITMKHEKVHRKYLWSKNYHNEFLNTAPPSSKAEFSDAIIHESDWRATNGQQ